MKVLVVYLGRAMFVQPAALGHQFADQCTVTTVVREEPSAENKWKPKMVPHQEALHWIAQGDGADAFFCYSGYGARIEHTLRQQGHEVLVEDRMPPGLPEPRVDLLRGLEWRGSQAQVLGTMVGVRNGIVVCPTGWGKCLGRGTPILMFDGSVKPVEQVQVGDRLMGPDSQPRNVLSVCAGIDELYTVTPVNGSPYIVNSAHILSLKMTGGMRGSRFSRGQIVNIPVTDYLSRSAYFKHCAKGWRSGVDFAKGAPLQLDPYFFGLWLGDGTSGRHADIVDFLRENDLLGHKHIPLTYLTASREDRLQLLAGIVDADGHYASSVYNMIFVSERLADDVIFLARSLGFAAYKSPQPKRCCNNGKWGDYFRFSISGPVEQIPCKLPRKRAKPRVQKKNHLVTGLKVTPAGRGAYFGFEIDGDRLFMLGDFTVTHNTVVLERLAALYPTASIVLTVPASDVARSLHERVSRSVSDCGFVGDGERKVRRVTVAVTHSLHHCDQNANLVVVDEAHAATTPELMPKLQRFMRAKFLALTATPVGRADKGDGYLEALFGPMIANVPYQEAVDTGNVVPLKVRVYHSRVGPDVSKIDNMARKNRFALWDNPARNQLIARAVHEALVDLGQDSQVLVMVSTIEHAMRLQQLLPDYVVVTGEPKDEESEEWFREVGIMQPWQKMCTKQARKAYRALFEAGTLKRAIANLVWSKGVDFKGLDILARADGLASLIQAGQIPGRLSRLGHDGQKPYGLLIDVKDSFSPDIEYRSINRINDYTRQGWPIEWRM